MPITYGFRSGPSNRLDSVPLDEGKFFVTNDTGQFYVDVKNVSNVVERLCLNPSASAQGAVMASDMDAAPTANSANAVTSGGVYAAINTLQSTLNSIQAVPNAELVRF